MTQSLRYEKNIGLIQLELAVEHRGCKLLEAKKVLGECLKRVEIPLQNNHKDNGSAWYKCLFICNPNPKEIENKLHGLEDNHLYFRDRNLTSNNLKIDVFFKDRIFDYISENNGNGFGNYFLDCYTPHANYRPYNKAMEYFRLEISSKKLFLNNILPELRKSNRLVDWKFSENGFNTNKYDALTLKEQYVLEYGLEKGFFDQPKGDSNIFEGLASELNENVHVLSEIAINTMEKSFDVISHNAFRNYEIVRG